MRKEDLVGPDNFFRALSLDDIYGGYSGDPKLTHWTPHHLERQLILNLAHAVSKPNETPTILEAACGSGFVSSLLAADGQTRVIGIDPNLNQAGTLRLGNVPGNTSLEECDFWDKVPSLGPVYDPDIQAEREDLLKKIREYQRSHGAIYERLHEEVQWGNPLALNQEVARLQELARRYISASPVSMVLCSFMPLDIELTIPIRDGIYPGCIVYTRIPEKRGTVGAGDFYNDPTKTACNYEVEEEAEVSEDTVISLNPGRNYKTVARWRTTQYNDWSSSQNTFHYLLGAEVVVQLRKDIALRSKLSTKVEKYGFDVEIERGIEYARRAKKGDWVFKDIDFLADIANISRNIFGSEK